MGDEIKGFGPLRARLGSKLGRMMPFWAGRPSMSSLGSIGQILETASIMGSAREGGVGVLFV